jgi:hypothetical protein
MPIAARRSLSHATLAAFAGLVLTVSMVAPLHAQSAPDAVGEVTYARDIAPILQRSCQSCHRPNSVAPMSLLTYEQVRPWAPLIKARTAIRDRMGTMPPWFIEKDIGIQGFRNDISLSDEEIALIAAWADAGAPLGNPADLPPPLQFAGANEWAIGEPDLVVDLNPHTMQANAPDWWGMIPPAPSGLTEDRYIAAMEVKEVSDIEGGTGGNFIFHHAILASVDPNGSTNPNWPVHEVGRNAEFFHPEAGRLLRAGSQFMVSGAHMNSNPVTTTAHLRIGFKFHPPGYSPTRRETLLTFGTSDIDLRPMTAGQQIQFEMTLPQNMKIVTFEPHMHAAGVRMCWEAVYRGRAETLNCAGYDHNWVKVYNYDDDSAPLLPRGTVLRVTGFFDVTPDNPNVIDPRNWGGLGHRSIDNMAIVFLPGIPLNEDEFQAEMALRRERLGLAPGQHVLGCPLCGGSEPQASAPATPR